MKTDFLMAQLDPAIAQGLFKIRVGISQERDNNEQQPIGRKINSTKTRSFPVFFLILALESSEIWDTAPKLHGFLIAYLKLGPQTASFPVSRE